MDEPRRDPWEGVKSPFDAEVIGPGDPGWEVLRLAMATGQPVIGEYDPDTGEVVSVRVVGPDEAPPPPVRRRTLWWAQLRRALGGTK